MSAGRPVLLAQEPTSAVCHARRRTLLGVPVAWSSAALATTLVAGLLVLPQVTHVLSVPGYDRMVDFMVYRTAGRSLLAHRSLYGTLSPFPESLPFTYPPFAAILLIPFAILPAGLGQAIWVAGCLVLVVPITLVAFRPLLSRVGPERAGVLLPVLAAGVAWLQPVAEVVRFGQVDTLIMAAALLDMLAPRTRWPRGALVGVATAVKLTPGLFIPYLWFSGRRREAGVATLSAIACTCVAFVMLPHASVGYWTSHLLHASRLGNNANTSNQSLRGAFLRSGLPGGVEVAMTVGAVGAVLVVGLVRAVRASRCGDELVALALTGLLAGLVSPVTWVHGFVWVAVAVGVIVADAGNRRRLALGAALALACMLPVWWWGTDLLGASQLGALAPALMVVQDALGIFVLALVLWLPARPLAWPRPAQRSAGADEVLPAGRAAASGRAPSGSSQTLTS